MAQVVERVVGSRWTWLALGVAVGMVLASGGVTAQSPPAARAAVQEVKTLYVDAHGGQSVANEVNAVCKTYAAQGWSFAGLESHLENNDTKGAWVTLVRPAP